MYLNALFESVLRYLQMGGLYPSAPLCKGSWAAAGRPEGLSGDGRWLFAFPSVTIPPTRLAPGHLPLHKGGFICINFRAVPSGEAIQTLQTIHSLPREGKRKRFLPPAPLCKGGCRADA